MCRPAFEPDVAAVRRLACGYDGVPASAPDAEFVERYLRILARDDWVLLVADDDGEVVGYALAQDYGPGLRRAFSTGRMHDLYVDPSHRRRGTGRMLVDAVVAWCRTRPAPMVLDWLSRPDAVAFYESLGLVGDTVGDAHEFPAYCVDLRPPAGG